LTRKARLSVPSHLHTGIDIRRPRPNYDNEPVYPMAEGVVISKRTDGPFAQLIVEHTIEGRQYWTVYEHIAGITVGVLARVDPTTPVARFLNRDELQHYGWQFDHVHFEVLRARPVHLKEDALKPERYYASYTLECHTPDDLHRYFFDPLEFLDECFARPPR
jgi:murein DD-endopeptidase MepM/ murein hydrolase activator NlpD